MGVNTEIIALFAECGRSIREGCHRNVGAATDLLDLRVHPIVPTEDRLRSGHLREPATQRCRKIISLPVSGPMFGVVARNLQCIGLDVDAQERGNRFAIARPHRPT